MPDWILTRNDLAARNAVLATLRDPAIKRMGFGVGSVLIFPFDYERVAKAIEGNKISVRVDPKGSAHMALYDYASDRFKIPPGGSNPDLLVHEATHAIFDIRKIATGTGVSEGMAYIAQALFQRIKFGPQARYVPAMDQGLISFMGWQMIFDLSRALAEVLIKTPYITRDRAEPLFNAVGMTVTYLGQGPNANYNGVPGA